MKRMAIALLGLAVGAGIGWSVVFVIYPWDTVAISTVGPQEHGYAFNFLGAVVGGAIGFVVAGLAALTWVHVEEYDPKRPPIVVDPRKVEDNLG
jgi:hypothetical protein